MPDRQKVLLNVDTGVDDALAILLTLRSHEVELVGITVTAGNVSVDQAAHNTRIVLETANRVDVPVILGAAHPLKKRLTTATLFNGADGLAGLSGPVGGQLNGDRDVVAFLLKAAVQYSHDLTVVSTGPLTNLALVLAKDNDWATKVKRIVIMGGAVAVPGNVTPCAEFNIWNDPEAADIVLQSRGELVLVGLDATVKALVAKEQIEAWRAHVINTPADGDKVPGFALQLVDFFARPGGTERVGIPMYDPLAAAVAIDPGLVTTRPMCVQVETVGELTRGQTVGNFSSSRPLFTDLGDYSDIVGSEPVLPNAVVALDVAAERFVGMLTHTIFGAKA